MSVQHAIRPADQAANGNIASGHAPARLFFVNELVYARQVAVLPTIAELSPVMRAAMACGKWLVALAGRIAAWRERARSRRSLASFDARLCKDIGITEIDLWREVNKPFWRD